MFKVISLKTGEPREVELIDLSHSLMLNSIVARVTPDGGLEHLGLITHQDLVFFAHAWATWTLEASKKKPPEAQEALRLVGLWLQDPSSVSNEELRSAGAAAWAAEAAASADVAAGAARAAAWAAARAAGAAWAAAYQKQGEFILEHLQKTSPGSFPFRRA